MLIDSVVQPFLVGTIAYVALVGLLRISGKRTLAKWNAFDLVVTVAFGSTLATAILSETTPLARVITAFATLIALQFLVTRASVTFPSVEQLVKSRPALLLRDGEMLQDAMRRERVTDAEILAALRSAGLSRMQDVAAVVLETDGEFSVIPRTADGAADTLTDVRKP